MMIGRISTLALLAGLAMGAPAVAAPSAAKVEAAAKVVQPKVIAWRRDIHENPELGNQEVRTAALIAKELRALGIEVRENVGKTGVVGVLKGGKPGKVVALRADMDALPVEEKTGLPFASKVKATWEGRTVPVMHACGHDTHVAMLLGAATVLAGMKQEIQGTVVFLFQPAEEGPPAGEEGGAKLMIRDGALDNPKVDAVFGVHIGPGDPHELNYRPEGFYASSDRITITVKGRQTHGARPWAGIDMASVAADIIQATNQIAARQVDVGISPSVLTIAHHQYGLPPEHHPRGPEDGGDHADLLQGAPRGPDRPHAEVCLRDRRPLRRQGRGGVHPALSGDLQRPGPVEVGEGDAGKGFAR